MAKRPTIKTISAGYTSTTTLNENFEALRDAFDNTLSRDGSIPNTMSGDLDLNGNDITNVNTLTDSSGNDFIAETRSLKDQAVASATAAATSATAAQTAQVATETAYNNVQPYLDEIEVLADDLSSGSFVAGSEYDFGLITDATTGTSGSPDGFVVTVFNNLDEIGTVAANDANITTVAGISAEVISVAGNEANIATVGTISADITTVAGISADVTSVAGNAADISAVAADATDIGTVAGLDTEIGALGAITADITAAAGNTADISTVAGVSANVTTVAGISADVSTVAANNANVTAVAGNASNINTVAGDSADINTLAPISTDITTAAANSSNITTVAGINADVTTVAGISSDVSTVATNNANVTTVATDISNVNAVGTDIANVNTVAANLADVNAFGQTYRIGATDPTTSLDVGDLFFNSTTGVLKVYDGVGWTAGVTAGSGFLALTGGTLTGTLTLDADPTTNLGAATKQYVDTEISGLVDSAPATLDTLNELAAALGDDANFSTTVTNSIATKLPLSGGTMTGDITFNSTQLFDGRDVSADGAKLDGIEAGADITDAANVEPLIDSHINVSGASSGQYLGWNGSDYAWSTVDLSTKLDLSGGTMTGAITFAAGQTFDGRDVSADGSKLDGIEAGADVTDATNVEAAGALMDSEISNLAAVKAINQSLSTTSSPTFSTVTAANFNTTSDATLKTNVETLTGSLDKVKALRGVSFDWKATSVPDIGVIAQEVEEVLPELVNINDNGIKSVKYSNIVGVLIEAIKEQQVQIDALKEKLGE